MAQAGTETRSARWRRRHRLKLTLLLAAGVLLTGCVFALDSVGTFERLELDSVDARFALRGAQVPPKDIVIVAIDDVTFDELERRWQDWPRSWYARVLRNLNRAGAKAVIYDVQFTEQSDSPEDDYDLYTAAGEARPVLFATTEVDDEGRSNVLGGDANLRMIGARAGHAELPQESDGVIRRMSHTIAKLKALGVVATEVVEKRRVAAPDDKEWIDFVGPPGTFKTVSFSRVYANKVPRNDLRGKVVVVGPTAPSLQDVHATSAGGGLMPGGEIQANTFNTARNDFPLRSTGDTTSLLIFLAFGLLAPLTNLVLSPLRALPILVGAGAAYLGISQLSFNAGTVLPVVAPIVALIVGGTGALAVDYFTETRERRRLRTIFSRFVPEAVVDQVVERADARLGGVRLVSTVLFCDLRGFTSFAETLEAEQVIDVLNHYLGEMSEAILDHGGTIVAYMGDGIMAVFGAPIELDDHADRALAAAREMMGTRLESFNAWIAEQGMEGQFQMGIGLNSGPVMSGNVGSERRMEYTAVGDTTNTAARLESMTKGTGHQLFVSETTRAMLKEQPEELSHHGDLPIRGRQHPLSVWVMDKGGQ